MRPNVLLLVLDSVRAKNTSLYDHVHDTTPFLAKFADESTVYEQARAPGVQSIPSHVSMFTGLHVEEHGVTSRDYRLKSGHTIWEQLNDEFGYDTGVFSSNVYLTGLDLGLKGAFDTVVGNADVPFPSAMNPDSFVRSRENYSYSAFVRACLRDNQPLRSIANGVLIKANQRNPRLLRSIFNRDASASRYAKEFLEWVDKRSGPWAACLNFMDTHYPFVPTRRRLRWSNEEMLKLQGELPDQAVWEFLGNERPWWQWNALEGLYDETIREVDSQVERLIQALKTRGEYENTLIVITSDHGEGFGESSNIRPGVRIAGHGAHAGLHESVLHVPLVVKFPKQKEQKRVADLASLIEFAPAVKQITQEARIDSDLFVPDGPVVASTPGIDERGREYASPFELDLKLYTNSLRAVYNQDGGELRKWMTWSDRAATIVIRGTTSHKLCSKGKVTIEDVFNGINDQDAKEKVTDRQHDSQVEDRLKELGYL